MAGKLKGIAVATQPLAPATMRKVSDGSTYHFRHADRGTNRRAEAVTPARTFLAVQR